MDIILILSLFLCASAAQDSVVPKIESAPKGNRPFTTSILKQLYSALGTTNRIVKFFFYNRNSSRNPELLTKRVRSDMFSNFDNNKPLKVIIHGWMQSDGVGFLSEVTEGLLKENDVNVVTVDWSEHGSVNLYSISRGKIPEVGIVVAKFLDILHDRYNLRLEDVHVIGYSLGAHIAGIAGRHVKNGKIGRITGLDPAGPGFSLNDTSTRLSQDSANFVDVIHTCGAFLGFADPIGHADFFPNNGQFIQPGCWFDWHGICSHMRSYQFLIESFQNRNAFPAISCRSWEDFKKERNTCDLANVVYMGEGASTSARGSFYLETNRYIPFGRGIGRV